MDLQSPNEVDSVKTQQNGEIFTFDHTSRAERHKVHRACLEAAQAVQMNELEKLHKSDLDAMHKDLAALIKKHSKSVHTADKKNRDVTKSDLEERAIKLGKKQRGEFARLHDAEKTKLMESHEAERKRLLETQAEEISDLEAIAESEEPSPSSHL
jgi:hypothetical protein